MATGLTAMATGHGKKSPVCKVCNDESSGFHYGVDSCEGCKGFFRRCITQGMHHRCNNSEKCEITPFTRNSCQYCRLKKCFAVGMSREASRLGRRPKKMKDIGSENKVAPVNVPIAPYPSPAEIYQLRMADLQRILQQNGTFKSELMEAFIAAQKINQNLDTKPDLTLLPGSESGYSSLSSPGSSKSQSPVHMGYVSQLGTGTSSSMIHTSIGSVNNGYGYMNGNSINGSMVVVKEEPENSPRSDMCNNGGDLTMGNGMSSYMTMVNNGDLLNGFNDMSLLMPDVMENEMMDDSGITDMDIQSDGVTNDIVQSSSDEQLQYRSTNNDLMDVRRDSHDMLDYSSVMVNPDQPISPPEAPPPDMPLLLPVGNNIPTPSPLHGNPFFDEPVFDAKQIYEAAHAPIVSETRVFLISRVTESLVTAHFATCNITHKTFSERRSVLSQKKALSTLADFEELNVDPSLMWQQFVAHMVPEITQVVKFCKKLPGFTEITQDDQILLIKQGSFEVLLIRFLLLIDVNTNEMFDPGMQVKCTRKVAIGMPLGSFFDEFFKIADMFNPLQLNDMEIGMFAAATIMCPDRKSLNNRKNIAKIQSLFFQALYHLLKKSHDDADRVFEGLLEVIPCLRNINDQHSKALNNMRMTSPNVANIFPELHKEIYDGNLDA